MNIKYESIPKESNLFHLKKEFFHNVQVPWHVHLEYELAYIHSTNGTKHVGSYFGLLEEDELLLLGPYLPHNWQIHKTACNTATDYQIVIHFSDHLFGQDFFDRYPFNGINSLLKKSELGVSFGKEMALKMRQKMEEMLHKNEFDRDVELLNVLNELATAPAQTQLSYYGFRDTHNEERVMRMNKVYEYISNNYKENISLEDIASVANMTPPAFCKYFKERTQKTLVEFLNEVRISHACEMLYSDENSVEQICYDSGFNSPSNFNKQFKKTLKMTPMEFRRKVRKEVYYKKKEGLSSALFHSLL